MLFALLLLAEAATADIAVGTDAGTVPVPLSDPGAWIRTTDYPATSLRNAEQGVTSFALRINPRGEVTNCLVIASSGSATLDSATCYLVSQRARFRPAFAGEGRPVDGTYSSRVRWVLPRIAGPKAGTLVVGFDVSAEGIVSGCRIESRSGAALDLPESRVPNCNEGARLLPYRDDKGAAIAKHIRMTMHVEESTLAN